MRLTRRRDSAVTVASSRVTERLRLALAAHGLEHFANEQQHADPADRNAMRYRNPRSMRRRTGELRAGRDAALD